MYEYTDKEEERFCEGAAHRIRCGMRRTILDLAEIGNELESVKAHLPHGRFRSWLEATFPGWSLASVRRYRLVARAVEQHPEALAFQSLTAAQEFAELEPPLQELVVEKQAFTRSVFHAVVWERTVEDHLADTRIGFARRHGDALRAVEEAHDDDALKEAAARVMARHGEAFAQLADRRREEVEAEAGITLEGRRPGPAGTVKAQLLERQNGGHCPCCGQAISTDLLYDLLQIWPGPIGIAIFPEQRDPAARAWQNAVVRAACERTDAKTVDALAREVL